MGSLDRPLLPLLVLAGLILSLAWLAPRLGLHGGQPWAHVGRAGLLAGLGVLLVAWGRRSDEPSPRWVGGAFLAAATLSLVLAADVTLFHTSIPSWLALAAPLAGVAWELILGRSARGTRR